MMSVHNGLFNCKHVHDLTSFTNAILQFFDQHSNLSFFPQHLTNIFKYINHSLIQLRDSSKEFTSVQMADALKLSNEIAIDVSAQN